MPAAKYNIIIEQGASFFRALTLKDAGGVEMNLTGWTVRGQVRASQSAASAVATFTCVVLDQTTNPGGVTIALTAADTTAIPQPTANTPPLVPGDFLYDIEAVRPDSSVFRLLQGKATLVPEITK